MATLAPPPADGRCFAVEPLSIGGGTIAIDTLGFFLLTAEQRPAPGVDRDDLPEAAASPPAEGGSPVAEGSEPASPKAADAPPPPPMSDEDEALRIAAVDAVLQSQTAADRDALAWWRSYAAEAVTAHHQQKRGVMALPAAAAGDARWSAEALRQMRRRTRRRPLSPAERAVVWPLFAGSVHCGDAAARFDALLRRDIETEHTEVMLRDLGRTLPTHCLFRGAASPGQRSLRRVLHAYCVVDSEVGYCQGMGFVVAVLLLHMPEVEAFTTFRQMMLGRQFLMRQLFQPGFPLLQHFFGVLRNLLGRYLPALSEHLAELGIDVAFFASHWFLTLFAYQFPAPLVSRIWDLFFAEGWSAVFKVTLALLQWDEAALLGMRMESVLLRIKTIHEGKNGDEIIARAMAMPVTQSDLRMLSGDAQL
jgi:hypothetical protein